MSLEGWKQLVAGWPWFLGEGSYPVAAYSEFMPPPRLLRKPYGPWDPLLVAEDDPWGWPVTEYEEAFTLTRGLESLAGRVLGKLIQLGQGDPGHGIGADLLG